MAMMSTSTTRCTRRLWVSALATSARKLARLMNAPKKAIGCSDELAHASLRLGVPEDLARAHELEACEHDPGVGVYLGANKSAAALEDARRYCRRFAREPGAAFLDRVAEAGTFPEALRAAGFAPAVDAAGDLRALAFVASRLPGHERFVVGLLRSFAGLTGARGARLRLAFDMTPRWWTTLLFDPGRLRRAHEPRTA